MYKQLLALLPNVVAKCDFCDAGRKCCGFSVQICMQKILSIPQTVQVLVGSLILLLIRNSIFDSGLIVDRG